METFIASVLLSSQNLTLERYLLNPPSPLFYKMLESLSSTISMGTWTLHQKGAQRVKQTAQGHQKSYFAAIPGHPQLRILPPHLKQHKAPWNELAPCTSHKNTARAVLQSRLSPPQSPASACVIFTLGMVFWSKEDELLFHKQSSKGLPPYATQVEQVPTTKDKGSKLLGD